MTVSSMTLFVGLVDRCRRPQRVSVTRLLAAIQPVGVPLCQLLSGNERLMALLGQLAMPAQGCSTRLPTQPYALWHPLRWAA